MGSFRCMFHPTTSLSYSHEEKKGLGFIDGNLWAQRHSFSKKILRYTEVCTCIFERTLLFTQENERLFQLNFPNYCACRKYTLHKVNQEFLRGTGQQYKGHWDQMFDDTIISFVPHFFFYLHLQVHPHIAFQIIFTEGYFTESAHIAHFSFIKMNCWCASVQKTNVQSQTALCPSPKRMPSVSRMCLSLMYSHRVQCWQRSVT